MAAFKVGDRVRLISCECQSIAGERGVVGREATIVAIPGSGFSRRAQCEIRIDNDPNLWAAAFYQLAPLTPPDAWAADAVRKVTRPVHVEPVAPKVTQ